MNSCERILATIRHEIPDRVPISVINIENVEELTKSLGMNYDEVMQHLGLDSYLIGVPYGGPIPADYMGQKVNEWGSPGGNDYGTAHNYPFQNNITIEDIRRHPWPDPAQYDYEHSAQYARRMYELGYAVRGPYWLPIFCRACDLFGMENAMLRMMTEPELIEAAFEEISSRTAEIVTRFLDASGDAVPILCLGDDFATQRGLMISPELWRAMIKPHLAKLFEIGKSRGKYIWFHSCGDVTAVLPDLIEIGMDVWETVQLHTLPISPEELKKKYGDKIAFFGGVSTQRLPFISPAEVAEETRRCIEWLGRDGGYICGPDHHIKPDISVENTLSLFNTIQNFRKDGYTSISS